MMNAVIVALVLPVSMMNELTNLLSTHTRVVEVFAIVLAAALLRYVLKLVLDRVASGLTKTRTLYDDALLDAIRKPLGWGIWILGICWAGQVAGGPEPDEPFSYIPKIREVAVVVLLVWFAARFIRFVEGHVSDQKYRENPVDPTTASAVGKLLRASVMITGVLMVLQTLGFSIAGVLAFGGIGGIGIGFAARDILANFFGALMIFLDRPFSVGDWIRSPDKEIEGTVEEIGWRLTRIRTFDQRLLYVQTTRRSIRIEHSW